MHSKSFSLSYTPSGHALRLIAAWLAVFAVTASFAPLGAGETLAQLGASSSGQLSVVVKDGHAVLTLNGATMLEYSFSSEKPKCFVRVLTTPGGINILRESPADHVHHRGLMFAVGVDEIDYWAEGPGCGVQRSLADFRVHSQQQNGKSLAVLQHGVQWVAPDGQPQLNEKRRLTWTFDRSQPEAALLVWESEFTVAGDAPERVLWGRPYFGLGCRFVESMDRDGQLWNARGGLDVEGTNNARAEWCAYAASAEGKPVTFVMFDYLNNLRSPATWFTMTQGFAYISATLNLAAAKLPLKQGETLTLRYAVAVADGKLENDDIVRLRLNFSRYLKDRQGQSTP